VPDHTSPAILPQRAASKYAGGGAAAAAVAASPCRRGAVFAFGAIDRAPGGTPPDR
jgi:hypothetical protein